MAASLPSNVTAQLKSGPADSVGMSAEHLARASALIEAAVEEKKITAAALVVARRSIVVMASGFGRLQPTETAPEVQPDSVFLLASITKPVTACALMLLVERGLVGLEDPVSKYLPEFEGGERHLVKVRHLLSHTSGLPDMLPENTQLRRAHAPLKEFVTRATKTPLLFTPNTEFRYQSKGTLLAAEIVERVTGKPLREFEHEEIFQPLGMNRSALGLGGMRIADTVWCGTSMDFGSEDQRRFGPNSGYWRDMGHPWGGMHSSALDLAVLLQTFLSGGEYGGRRVFSRAVVREMTRNHNGSLEAPWGLGWALGRSVVWNDFGDLVSPATFGHTGATGTVAWADPSRDLLCVILTNERFDGGAFMRRVSNVVVAAVLD